MFEIPEPTQQDFFNFLKKENLLDLYDYLKINKYIVPFFTYREWMNLYAVYRAINDNFPFEYYINKMIFKV